MIARFAGCTLAEADEARRALGDVEGMAETKLWFFPRALARGYSAPGRRGDLEGPRGVRVVRLLQGARRGVRAADLPVRLAQGALPGALPVRGAHPRPGHVPQAADPRRRPPVRHRGARPRRQRLARRRTSSSGSGSTTSRRPRCWATPPRRAPEPGLPDGRGYGIRLALSEVKGISEAEVDRIVAARPYHRSPTSGTAPRCPGRCVERLVLAGGFDSVYGIGRRRGLGRTPPGHGHPARPAAPGGRPRPARPGRRPGRKGRGRGLASRGAPPGGRVAAAGRAEDAAPRNSSDDLVRGPAARATRAAGAREPPGTAQAPGTGLACTPAASRRGLGAGRPAVAGDPAAAPVTSVQLALDLGDAPVDGEVSGLPEMNDAERVRAELEILGLDASRHVVRLLRPVPRRARGDPVRRPARAGAAGPSCWSPGSRSPPRPRRSGPGAGWSS